MLVRKLFPLAIFLVIAGFLWKGLYLNPKFKTKGIRFNSNSFSVPKFNMTKLENDRIVNESIFRDKISIVRVWASWCGYCKGQNSFFNEISTYTNSKTNLQLIGINFNDIKEDAIRFLTEYGNPFKYNIFDKNGIISMSIGVSGTPETYLIDCNGIIKYKYLGPLTKDEFNKLFVPEINKLKDSG